VGILEEQLQKVHELEDEIRNQNDVISDKEKTVIGLRTQIAEREEALTSQLQKLNQAQHKLAMAENEKTLLEVSMVEREASIETLEIETGQLKNQEISLKTQLSELQKKHDESASSCSTLDQELKMATRIKDDYQSQASGLKGTLQTLQEDNDRLKEVIDDTQTTLTEAKEAHKAFKVECEREVRLSACQ